MVLELVAAGLTDCAVARETGVARTTVRDMRRSAEDPTRRACPRCWRLARPLDFDTARYAELLGFYLGDGHVSAVGRTDRLRISLDARHGLIVDDVVRLLRSSFPANHVGIVFNDDGATAVPYVYSNHLRCLFPQAGAGLKHDRPIVLEDWQWRAVREAPWSFLRGLTHSDGCLFINRTGRYAYLSVAFSNRSPDVLELFAAACDLVGVQFRRNGDHIRIYRRGSVREFAAFVGSKR